VLVAACQGFFEEDVRSEDSGVEVADRGSLGWGGNNPRKEIGNILQLFAICEIFRGVKK